MLYLIRITIIYIFSTKGKDTGARTIHKWVKCYLFIFTYATLIFLLINAYTEKELQIKKLKFRIVALQSNKNDRLKLKFRVGTIHYLYKYFFINRII